MSTSPPNFNYLFATLLLTLLFSPRLNCSSISHDGSLVAGGFSDSSIKVWDMAKIGQAGSGMLIL
jgi:WD40 repeat protein